MVTVVRARRARAIRFTTKTITVRPSTVWSSWLAHKKPSRRRDTSRSKIRAPHIMRDALKCTLLSPPAVAAIVRMTVAVCAEDSARATGGARDTTRCTTCVPAPFARLPPGLQHHSSSPSWQLPSASQQHAAEPSGHVGACSSFRPRNTRTVAGTIGPTHREIHAACDQLHIIAHANSPDVRVTDLHAH